MALWTRKKTNSGPELPEWVDPPSDLNDFGQRVEAVGLASVADDLVALVRPSARLELDRAVDVQAVCGSRLGGQPDLDPDQGWPQGPNGPLSFIAQINLSEAAVALPGSGLPLTGLLSFFYDAITQAAWGFDPKDRSSWAVVYAPDVATCTTREWPAELADEGRFDALGLSLAHELTYPAAESFDVAQLDIESPWTLYSRVLGDQEGLLSRLLGNPDPVQGDMQVECQLASNGIFCGHGDYLKLPGAESLIPGAAHWRLLLQIDSHEDVGMMWGDVGRLYFWITEQDLAAQSWGATWMVLQCC